MVVTVRDGVCFKSLKFCRTDPAMGREVNFRRLRQEKICEEGVYN